MTVADFKQQYDVKFDVKQSPTQTYEGTDIPIKYARLNKTISGQDYMVLSRHAAAEATSSEAFAKLEVKYDETHGYGIVRRDGGILLFSL